MVERSRWMVGVLTVAGLSLAGCSSGDDSATGSTSTPMGGATTALGATTVAAAEPTAGAVTAPAASAAPTETAAVPETSDAASPWVEASPVAEQSTSPVSSPLADGRYYGTDVAANGDTITLTLRQLVFGDDCAAMFPDDPDTACASGGFVVDEPSSSITTGAALAAATVVSGNGSPTYAVPVELLPTVLASGTGPGAPDGFSIQVPAVFIVTVADGEIVQLDQLFRS